MDEEIQTPAQDLNHKNEKKRRTRIPEKPAIHVNIWSLLKDFIGQDINKISLPIALHEPISMLQRLSEMFEYSNLLDEAAKYEDICEQIAYVTTFSIAGYSVTDNRLTKPFNPILGETFEFDRTDDLGWRLIAEQVSHHPPISVLYCTSDKWHCYLEFRVNTTFHGNSIEVTPLGSLYIEFDQPKRKYIWTKQIKTRVNNLILGNTYMEHYGDMEVIEEDVGGTQGAICQVKFFESNKKNNYAKIEGKVTNNNGEPKFALKGQWNKELEIAPITNDDENKEIVGEYKMVWTRTPSIAESFKYYNFTEFACQLNELDNQIAPTDSRFRPDQRLMEEGNWEEAGKKKLYLQIKQREAIKESEQPPVWFNRVQDGEQQVHVFGGDYWKCKERQDWTRCPDIF